MKKKEQIQIICTIGFSNTQQSSMYDEMSIDLLKAHGIVFETPEGVVGLTRKGVLLYESILKIFELAQS